MLSFTRGRGERVSEARLSTNEKCAGKEKKLQNYL